MLYITLGFNVEGKISNTSGYFNSKYKVDWLNNDLAKEIIKDIDNSIHVKDHVIESPVLGAIPPIWLSTGCKGLLILLNSPSGIILSGERFGDNCFKWLSKLGEQKDVYITLSHYLDEEDIPLTATITNNGKVVRSSGGINTEILCWECEVDSDEFRKDLNIKEGM